MPPQKPHGEDCFAFFARGGNGSDERVGAWMDPVGDRGEAAALAGAVLRHAGLKNEHFVEIDDERAGGLQNDAQTRRRIGRQVEVLSVVDLSLLGGWNRPGSDVGDHPVDIFICNFVPIGRNGLWKDPTDPEILVIQNPGELNRNVRFAWLSMSNENGMNIEFDIHVITTRHKRDEAKNEEENGNEMEPSGRMRTCEKE